MTEIAKLARRGALPLLVLALATGACDRTDPTEPAVSSDAVIDAVTAVEAVSFASRSFRGGIPFGTFHLPQEQYGDTYNGSLGNIYPRTVIESLELARRSGTKLILNMGGSEQNFRNRNGTLSMDKWRKQVDRFRGINFGPYIADGTLIGHYIVDEPHDPVNWGGRPLSKSTIDEMARYSKRLWPTLPTMVRAYPTWMKGYKWKYVDAAWAQYSNRHGSVSQFIENNVRAAKESGLALVGGFNLSGDGSRGISGYFDGRAVGPSELRDWGSVLLAQPHLCAFIMWKWDSRYMGRSDVKSAMATLSQKARNRSSRSCRGNATSGVDEDDDDDDGGDNDGGDNDDGDDDGNGTPAGGNKQPGGGGVTPAPSIVLAVEGSRNSRTHYMRLTWSGASGSMVDVYRNGELRKTTENDRKYTNSRDFRGPATYVYKVCERGSSRCSNEATATFR